MKIKYIFFNGVNLSIYCLLSVFFASCDDFLDEPLSKGSSVTISTTADLSKLLNNYQDFYKVNNYVAIYGTDDNGFSSALYSANPYGFSAAVVQFSLWDTENLPQTDQSSWQGQNLWTTEYYKIFQANLVLSLLENVQGTDSEKATLKAEAHFIRAYSYFELVNTYCLPYNTTNLAEPGLPLKLLPDYKTVGRSTLEETYNLIESDLQEALKIETPLVQNGVARNWRASKAGVNGFAARYFLSKGNYDQALLFAQASLSNYSQLVDYKSEMSFGNPATVNVDGNPVQIDFPYTHDKVITDDISDAIGWKEVLYYRLYVNEGAWFIPSQELLNLYNKTDDLRYKYNIVENFSYFKGVLYPPYDYPGYVFFDNTAMPQGPTVAEMILIKAECMARSGNVSGAVTAVNELYSKRTVAGAIPLAAATKDAAIHVIIEERRREMPFGNRWFDIRRLNNNTDPNDDIDILQKDFYPYSGNSVSTSSPLKTYSLAKGSRRFASPLPQNEVESSDGVIKQNTY